MQIIKSSLSAARQALGSRRGRVIIAVTAALAVFATRARSVVSNAPEKSRATLQGVTSQVRGLIGQESGEGQQGAVAQPEVTAPPSKTEGASGTAQGIAEPPTLPEEPPAILAAGEDETGTFRPTRVEPDDFGAVVTDVEPAGLAASNWVEGDGSYDCPQELPDQGQRHLTYLPPPGRILIRAHDPQRLLRHRGRRCRRRLPPPREIAGSPVGFPGKPAPG